MKQHRVTVSYSFTKYVFSLDEKIEAIAPRNYVGSGTSIGAPKPEREHNFEFKTAYASKKAVAKFKALKINEIRGLKIEETP